MARIMLIGANGQLGSDLCQAFQSAPYELVPLNRADIDIRNHEQVADVLASLQPHATVALHPTPAPRRFAVSP